MEDDLSLEDISHGTRNKIIQHRIQIADRTREHKIEVENAKYDNTWESACFKVDRRAIQYLTQILIILGTMSFSIAQLIRLDDCESQGAYLGLLTMLIGLLLPNPKFS
jgi:hypothetical protein